MIHTKDITFSYSEKVNFSFPDIRTESGETLLITGGSGKGKTTLLHLLGGLLRPKSGSVSIGETSISNLSEKQLDQFRGKNIGLVLQQSHFVEAFSVLENVILASWLATGKKAEEKAKVLEKENVKEQALEMKPKTLIKQMQKPYNGFLSLMFLCLIVSLLSTSILLYIIISNGLLG